MNYYTNIHLLKTFLIHILIYTSIFKLFSGLHGGKEGGGMYVVVQSQKHYTSTLRFNNIASFIDMH